MNPKGSKIRSRGLSPELVEGRYPRTWCGEWAHPGGVPEPSSFNQRFPRDYSAQTTTSWAWYL
jgi:hypothetical protein